MRWLILFLLIPSVLVAQFSQEETDGAKNRLLHGFALDTLETRRLLRVSLETRQRRQEIDRIFPVGAEKILEAVFELGRRRIVGAAVQDARPSAKEVGEGVKAQSRTNG